MGITHVDKILSEERIDCDGILNVTLSVTAQPDVVNNPVDIALVLDRSGSMTGTPMMHLKAGAKEFIDIVMKRTGGRMGRLANGNRIGIVSFAGTASIDVPLTEDVEVLKQAVDALQAQGNTNHADAFTQAGTLFGATMRKKVLVIFTDGETTVGPDPAPIAAALRDDDVEIYCIGLVGRTGLNEETLRSWASEPVDEHVITTPNEEELERAFHDLADTIAGPGATNIHIEDIISTEFAIIGFEPPLIGEAELESSQIIHWYISELADSEEETAELMFTVRHMSGSGGHIEVNDSIQLTDDEGSVVEFPSPFVTVDCGSIIVPECPEPIDVHADPCQDSIFVDAGDIIMTDLGRILQVDFVLHDICPHRRTSVGIIVTELMDDGIEASRGFKVLTIPAHTGSGCRDVHVMCVPFVLPEDPDACGCNNGMCTGRTFRVRIIAHPMDYTVGLYVCARLPLFRGSGGALPGRAAAPPAKAARHRAAFARFAVSYAILAQSAFFAKKTFARRKKRYNESREIRAPYPARKTIRSIKGVYQYDPEKRPCFHRRRALCAGGRGDRGRKDRSGGCPRHAGRPRRSGRFRQIRHPGFCGYPHPRLQRL